jgi:oryzin
MLTSQVAYVEEDQEWEIDHIVGNRNLLNKRDLTTQANSSWGLAAVSHRTPGNDEYIYEESAGENTYAYVIDTGILTTHEEFEDRAERLFSAFPDDDEDTAGHGTHVAGTIVGKKYGVAKLAKVYGVKVFQGSSTSTSAIVAGVDAAVDHIIENDRVDSSVINMSLGGPITTALDEAVIDATSQGIVVVVAAGNYMEDIADVSPARTPSSITVGAVNSAWDRWVDNRTTSLGSNVGGEMDIWGPGQDIISAYPEADDAYEVLSGTSMAAPHVAGLVLYAMSVDGVSGVKEVTKHLVDTATSGVVGGPIADSPNLLGNNGNGQAKMALGRSDSE